MDLTLKTAQTLFVDTAPLIYFFERNKRYYKKMSRLFDAVYDTGSQIVVSMITYMEISVLPAKQGNMKLVAKYREYFTNSENVTLYPVNLLVSEKAVFYRAKYNLRTPDALQLATAEVCGADYVISNDRQWRNVEELDVIVLADM